MSSLNLRELSETGVEELTRHLSASDLRELMETFAGAVGLAVGVVGSRGKRVTSIANHHQFCKYVRRTVEGKAACRDSDLRPVKASMCRNDAVAHMCHAGLADCVDVIRICGRPVALVYMGQARLSEQVSEEKLRALYNRLQTTQKNVSFSRFVRAYKELPIKSKEELDCARRLLHALAVQITQRVSERAALEIVQEIGATTSSTLDLNAGLEVIFEKAKQVVPFDTGSISLWDPERKCLAPQVYHWGSATANRRLAKMTFARREGLLGRMVRRTKPLLLRTRAEVDRIEPKDPRSRRSRRLRCFLGVPIVVRGEAVGAFEVGARRDNAFDRNDVTLLELMASQVAAFLRMVRERAYFVELAREVDVDRLLDTIVRRVPQMVRGRGCSVFLRDEHSDSFVLAATTGIIPKRHQRGTPIFYKSGEGLTGWVGKTGRTLRIPDRRKKTLEKISPDLRWSHKYAEAARRLRADRSFLAAALKRERDVVGVIRISDGYGVEFSPEDQAILEATAMHIVSAMERARRLRSRVVETLRRTTDELRGQFDLEVILNRVVESASELIPSEAASLYLVEPDDRIRIRAAQGTAKALLGEASYKPGEGVTGWIVKTRQVVRARSYDELRSHSAWMGKYDHFWPQRDVESYFGIPLVAGRGQVVGVLKVEKRLPSEGHRKLHFSDEDERILEVLGAVASLAIDNARLFGEKYRETVLALHEMAQAIMGKGELEDVARSVVGSIARIVNAEASSLFLHHPATKRLVMRAAVGYHSSMVGQATYEIGEGITGWIAKTGEPFKAESTGQLRQHPAWCGKYDRLQWEQPNECRSFLGVPLRVGTNKVGVLKVENKRGTSARADTSFSPDDERILFALAGVVAVLIEDVRLRAEVLRERALREAVDHVAGETAHSIGTALLPATTYQVILEERVKALPKAVRGNLEEPLEKIGASCEAAKRSVRKIREYSVPLRLEPRRSSIVRLVRTCLADMLGKHGSFAVVNKARTSVAVADTERMADVFRELAVNAMKAKSAGLKVIVVLAQVRRNRCPWLRVLFSDNGPGLPKKYKEHIFNRHFSLSSDRRDTGLGLYFVRRIIEAHGGTVAEIGRYRSGGTFEILLPQQDGGT